MAFSSNHINQLLEAINTMRDQRIAFDVPSFDHEDIARVFIKPEDMEVLQRAADLVETRYMDRMIQAAVQTDAFDTPVRIVLRLTNTRPDNKPMYLVPQYATSGYTREPMRVGSAIESYIVECINTFISFSYVKTVLNRLDEICQHESQVAFFWPVVRVLADITNDGKLKKSFDKKTRTPMPPLPPHIRAACKETAEIVTSAHILGKPPERKSPFTLYIASNRLICRHTPIGDIVYQA